MIDIPSIRARLHKQSHVARSNVQRRHANDEANEAKQNGTDNVPELISLVSQCFTWHVRALGQTTHLFLAAIRVPRNRNRHQARKHPRRGAHEQSRHVAEAQRAGERGEEGVERQTHDIGRKCEHHDVNLGVLDGHDETGSGRLSLGIDIGLTDILRHAKLGHLELVRGEAAAVGRQVGEDKGGDNGNEHGDGTLDCECQC